MLCQHLDSDLLIKHAPEEAFFCDKTKAQCKTRLCGRLSEVCVRGVLIGGETSRTFLVREEASLAAPSVELRHNFLQTRHHIQSLSRMVGPVQVQFSGTSPGLRLVPGV